MNYCIGIDTGGTYTDAVIYDFASHAVIAKSKSPTTRQDLSIGIERALEQLPDELLKKAGQVSLSTTLATNACVEDKGGRAKLVMIGTARSTLEWIHADVKYGLNYDDVLCLDSKSTFDGKVVEHPDWAAVLEENDEFFRRAEALSIAALNAQHNGGISEIVARDALRAKYDVPVIMASELVTGINVIERGATALLNARLLPVVDQFMKAVGKAFSRRGLDIPQMIVRSDGSLMVDSLAHIRPVETILSGPAASVMGCRALTQVDQCLLIDMGGTTTDISIIRKGIPSMTGGIRIGGWRTQVKGVFIDTFGLGGDTRMYIAEGELKLDTRRVEPLCCAAAKWPSMKEELESLFSKPALHTRSLHEFLYLVRKPADMSVYSAAEVDLIASLESGPQMIGGSVLDMYTLNSERLEREGIIMRCGLTPTDIMHVRGDYAAFDAEASALAARYFLRVLPAYEDNEGGMAAFCEDAYEQVKRRLFENIARVFVETEYPELCKNGIGEQFRALIAHKWEHRNDPAGDGFFNIGLHTSASLIGLGAPTHIFLPDVARALGANCIIPEHSEVANAIGAAVADVVAQVSVEIRTNYSGDGLVDYSVHASGVHEVFEEYDDALETAHVIARRMAVEEAVKRGATGEPEVEISVERHTSHSREGSEIDLGTFVVACATDRIAKYQ